MNCAACGGDNREDANFCRHCGASLSEEHEVEATVAEAAAEAESRDLRAASEDLAVEEMTGEVLPEAGLEDSLLHGIQPEGEGVLEGPEALDAGPGEFELDAGTLADVSQVALLAEPSTDREEIDSALHDSEDLPLTEPAQRTSAEGAPGAAPETPTETVGDSEGEQPADRAKLDEVLLDPALVTQVEEDQLTPGEGPQALEPLEAGTLVAGRYLVVEVLDEDRDKNLYRARDLLGCWHCGYGANAPDDSFCAQCGASLDRRADVSLLEVAEEEYVPSAGEPVLAHLVDENRSFVVLAQPEMVKAERVPDEPAGTRLIVGQRSDAGLLRELDEDSLLSLTLSPTYESRTGPVLGMFAVADGMGGHAGGEVASKMALQVLSQELLLTILAPEMAGESLSQDQITDRLRQATEAANDAVYLARNKRDNDMGTTITTALVRDRELFLAHVGDCRAYVWNAGGLAQLTEDHSLVASMVAAGQAVPEDLYTHPQRSIIYRCIGDQPLVEVDTAARTLCSGDRIIICCDGLWEMIRNEGIEDVMMQEADPQVACDLLVSHANLAGGEDNISVIVVQVEAM